LQLLSTLTRHIDQNRYDSNSAAYGLLQSTTSALAAVQEDDLAGNLQLLFTETQKVLNWQEDLLAQQIASSEAELTIGDPLSSGQDSGQSEFGNVVQEASEKAAAQNKDGGGVAQASDVEIAVESVEADTQHTPGDGARILTDDLKLEISTLRQSLQDEIAALRKELKR